jgi:hypothetical protein
MEPIHRILIDEGRTEPSPPEAGKRRMPAISTVMMALLGATALWLGLTLAWLCRKTERLIAAGSAAGLSVSEISALKANVADWMRKSKA